MYIRSGEFDNKISRAADRLRYQLKLAHLQPIARIIKIKYKLANIDVGSTADVARTTYIQTTNTPPAPRAVVQTPGSEILLVLTLSGPPVQRAHIRCCFTSVLGVAAHRNAYTTDFE
ncbi:hypothetical protein PMIN01_10768 [Paraphaeosphaeria minitans]|uniref:Uncharacterized protein n=1 Tax=Paraphaeosphaeria minitans TaxID=565426 RepID=A0A9P6G9Q3_9PLEO|nr:hypothetical protein PMIN01_10768 [Paraphaeosphaeria minitans]